VVDNLSSDHFSGSDRLERNEILGYTIRLTLTRSFGAKHQETRSRVLRDYNQAFELLSDLECLSEFLDSSLSVVGKCTQRQQGGKLSGKDGDNDLLRVDLGN
jgi:hypothetical protein